MDAPSGIVRTWLQTVTSTVTVTLCSFLTSVLTARMLGPQGRGLMAAALLVAALSSGIAQMGLANSLVYHCGKGHPIHARLFIVASASLVTLLTLPLSLVGMMHLYPAAYEQQTLLTVLLGASSAIFSFAATAAQIRVDLKVYNATRAVLPLSFAAFLLGILIAGATLDYTSIMLFQTVVMAALSAWILVHVWEHLPDEPKPAGHMASDIGAVGGYALRYHGTILLSLLLLNIDKIFLISKVDPAQFGLYTLAFATTRVLGSVQDAAAVTTFARFAGKDGSGLEAAVAMAFRLSFMPMMLVAVLLAVVSPLIIPMLFGAAFISMAVPFVLLSFEAVLGAASWTLAQRFNAGGRPGMILLRQGLVTLPLLAALPYLPAKDTAAWLAALMLGAALARLAITLAMIPLILKEPLPSIFPSWRELTEQARRLRNRWSATH
jgi:antigen flippase